ncbi:unnamed protein product [Linum trigynum]|uniref:Uncharacterized protein n=1 Tax=Linum trigynum TaxID=586398 RepID=A0AAV2CFX3_9ROSI
MNMHGAEVGPVRISESDCRILPPNRVVDGGEGSASANSPRRNGGTQEVEEEELRDGSASTVLDRASTRKEREKSPVKVLVRRHHDPRRQIFPPNLTIRRDRGTQEYEEKGNHTEEGEIEGIWRVTSEEGEVWSSGRGNEG